MVCGAFRTATDCPIRISHARLRDAAYQRRRRRGVKPRNRHRAGRVCVIRAPARSAVAGPVLDQPAQAVIRVLYPVRRRAPELRERHPVVVVGPYLVVKVCFGPFAPRPQLIYLREEGCFVCLHFSQFVLDEGQAQLFIHRFIIAHGGILCYNVCAVLP